MRTSKNERKMVIQVTMICDGVKKRAKEQSKAMLPRGLA